MAKRQTLSLRFGVAGSGKTYSAVCDVIHEWAPYEVGRLITNLPLYPDKIADFVKKDVASKQRLKVDDARVRVLGRIHIIPEEEMKRWAAGVSGPWEYLLGLDITGCHLVIDEFHNFGGVAHDDAHIAKWMGWFGELRHRGATCEIMSQDIGKVATRIINEAGMRVEVSPLEEEVDPFFRVRLGDYFQVWARWFTGNYIGGAFEARKRKNDRRWVVLRRTKWIYRKQVFALYNSFSKPHGDLKETSGRPLMEWERLTRFGILVWFFRRNVIQVAVMLFVVFGLMFVSSGGVPWAMKKLMQLGVAAARKNKSGASPTQAQLVAGLPEDSDYYKQEIAKVGQTPFVQEIVRLQERLKVVEEQSEQLKEANNVLYKANELTMNRLLWYTTLSAMEPDRVVTKSGVVWRLNETISDGGLYNGLRLVAINWERRFCQLSNGAVLRLPTVAKPPAEPTSTDGSNSKGGGGAAVATKNDSPTRTADNSGSGRLEPVGPQPIPRREDRFGNSDFGAVGRPQGNTVGGKVAGGNGVVGNSASVGSPVFQGGPGAVFGGSKAGGSGNLVPTSDPRFGGRFQPTPAVRRQ